MSLKPSDAKVTTLVTLAREQLDAGNNQPAAGQLRGAEHLSIAALAYRVSAHIRLDLRTANCLPPAPEKHFKLGCFLSPDQAAKERRYAEAIIHIHIAVRRHLPKPLGVKPVDKRKNEPIWQLDPYIGHVNVHRPF